MLFRESGIAKIKRLMIFRRLISKGFAFILPFFLAFGATYGNTEVADDYTRLLEFIQLDDQQQPLYVFNDFEEEFDEASHRATRQYFKEHPGLIQQNFLKTNIPSGKTAPPIPSQR